MSGYGPPHGRGYVGQHRAHWRDTRAVRRAQQATVLDLFLAVYDWARIPWRNLAASTGRRRELGVGAR